MSCARLFVVAAVALALSGHLNVATAAEPVFTVRGHAIWDLEPVDYYINQISINAWRDDAGVHGHACWLTNYYNWNGQNERGWVWEMDVVEMYYFDEATVEFVGIITYDTRYPEFVGTPVYFTLKDNGRDPAVPDELLGYPILGGNFTVR
jgi:hypothetical protein